MGFIAEESTQGGCISGAARRSAIDFEKESDNPHRYQPRCPRM